MTERPEERAVMTFGWISTVCSFEAPKKGARRRLPSDGLQVLGWSRTCCHVRRDHPRFSRPAARVLRPCRTREKGGVGVRHTLFPHSLAFGAQLHPSSVAGCQFPDAASAWARTQPAVSGSAAEPAATQVLPRHGRLYRVRLLGRISHCACRRTAARPGRPRGCRLFLSAPRPLSARSAPGRSLLSDRAVGLAPRVLPLTPQVAFALSPACRRSLSGSPRARVLSPARRRDALLAPLGHPDRLTPRAPVPLARRRLRRHRPSDGSLRCASDFPSGTGMFPHWLTVATSGGAPTDCVRPCSPKPRTAHA